MSASLSTSTTPPQQRRSAQLHSDEPSLSWSDPAAVPGMRSMSISGSVLIDEAEAALFFEKGDCGERGGEQGCSPLRSCLAPQLTRAEQCAVRGLMAAHPYLDEERIALLVTAKKSRAECHRIAPSYYRLCELYSLRTLAVEQLFRALGSGWVFPILPLPSTTAGLEDGVGQPQRSIFLRPGVFEFDRDLAAATAPPLRQPSSPSSRAPRRREDTFLIAVRMRNMTASHTAEDVVRALFFVLEWVLHGHPTAPRNGIALLIDMRGAAVHTLDKFFRQQLIGDVMRSFVNVFPARINAIYIFHCASILGLAVRALRSFLPDKIAARVHVVSYALLRSKICANVELLVEHDDGAMFMNWWQQHVLRQCRTASPALREALSRDGSGATPRCCANAPSSLPAARSGGDHDTDIATSATARRSGELQAMKVAAAELLGHLRLEESERALWFEVEAMNWSELLRREEAARRGIEVAAAERARRKRRARELELAHQGQRAAIETAETHRRASAVVEEEMRARVLLRIELRANLDTLRRVAREREAAWRQRMARLSHLERERAALLDGAEATAWNSLMSDELESRRQAMAAERRRWAAFCAAVRCLADEEASDRDALSVEEADAADAWRGAGAQLHASTGAGVHLQLVAEPAARRELTSEELAAARALFWGSATLLGVAAREDTARRALCEAAGGALAFFVRLSAEVIGEEYVQRAALQAAFFSQRHRELVACIAGAVDMCCEATLRHAHRRLFGRERGALLLATSLNAMSTSFLSDRMHTVMLAEGRGGELEPVSLFDEFLEEAAIIEAIIVPERVDREAIEEVFFAQHDAFADELRRRMTHQSVFNASSSSQLSGGHGASTARDDLANDSFDDDSTRADADADCSSPRTPGGGRHRFFRRRGAGVGEAAEHRRARRGAPRVSIVGEEGAAGDVGDSGANNGSLSESSVGIASRCSPPRPSGDGDPDGGGAPLRRRRSSFIFREIKGLSESNAPSSRTSPTDELLLNSPRGDLPVPLDPAALTRPPSFAATAATAGHAHGGPKPLCAWRAVTSDGSGASGALMNSEGESSDEDEGVEHVVQRGPRPVSWRGVPGSAGSTSALMRSSPSSSSPGNSRAAQRGMPLSIERSHSALRWSSGSLTDRQRERLAAAQAALDLEEASLAEERNLLGMGAASAGAQQRVQPSHRHFRAAAAAPSDESTGDEDASPLSISSDTLMRANLHRQYAPRVTDAQPSQEARADVARGGLPPVELCAYSFPEEESIGTTTPASHRSCSSGNNGAANSSGGGADPGATHDGPAPLTATADSWYHSSNPSSRTSCASDVATSASADDDDDGEEHTKERRPDAGRYPMQEHDPPELSRHKSGTIAVEDF